MKGKHIGHNKDNSNKTHESSSYGSVPFSSYKKYKWPNLYITIPIKIVNNHKYNGISGALNININAMPTNQITLINLYRIFIRLFLIKLDTQLNLIEYLHCLRFDLIFDLVYHRF